MNRSLIFDDNLKLFIDVAHEVLLLQLLHCMGYHCVVLVTPELYLFDAGEVLDPLVHVVSHVNERLEIFHGSFLKPNNMRTLRGR